MALFKCLLLSLLGNTICKNLNLVYLLFNYFYVIT